MRDCGKMALMDRLLGKLRAEGHKVLIFSQVNTGVGGSLLFFVVDTMHVGVCWMHASSPAAEPVRCRLWSVVF